MKEYILTLLYPSGEQRSVRKLLTTKEQLFAIAHVGVADKNGTKLIKAEPVEIDIMAEILRSIHPTQKN